MSALVSYESSSDEETTLPPSATTILQATTRTVPAVNGEPKIQEEAVSQERGVEGPSATVIGPQMPANTSIQAEEDDLLANLRDNVSEQDFIRHLTQATHPMTAFPPSPPGSPNPQVEARFKRFLELKQTGLHFNEDLAKKSSFRNPAVLTTLMNRAGLTGDDQYATSLPKNVWDPQSLPLFAYKEALLKSQQTIHEEQAVRKKQQSANGKRVIDFASSTASGGSSRQSTPSGH